VPVGRGVFKARKREVVKIYEEHEDVFIKSLRVLHTCDSVFAFKRLYKIPLYERGARRAGCVRPRRKEVADV
jgi:hypothetical protein